MKRKIQIIIAAVICLIPTLVLAATPTTYKEFVLLVVRLVTRAITLLGGLITLYFIWVIWQSFFVKGADDTKAIEQGRAALVYAIISIAALGSLWAVVAIVKRTFFP